MFFIIYARNEVQHRGGTVGTSTHPLSRLPTDSCRYRKA